MERAAFESFIKNDKKWLMNDQSKLMNELLNIYTIKLKNEKYETYIIKAADELSD